MHVSKGGVADAGAGEGGKWPSSNRHSQGGKQTIAKVPWTMHLYNGNSSGREREGRGRMGAEWTAIERDHDTIDQNASLC